MSSDEIKTDPKKVSDSARKNPPNSDRIKLILTDLQSACASLIEENRQLKSKIQELEQKLNLNEASKLENEHGTRHLFSKRMGALLDGASHKLKINRIKTVKHRDCVLENKICYAHADVATAVQARNVHVISGSLDSTVKVWTCDLEKCLAVYRGHTHPVNTCKFSVLDENLVCSGSGDGSVHVWSLKHLTDFASESNIESRSNHESMLEDFTKGSDPLILSEKLFPINKPILDLKIHQAPVSSVDWTYDDKNVISASWDNSLVIWDVEKAKAILTLNEHEDEVTYVSCHPSQKLFVSASADSTIRLWDMRSAKTPSVSICHGHNGEVNSAIFSGTFIVSGGSDKSCKLWELKSLREPVASLKTSAPVTQLKII